jgi:hypothetical protein
VVLSLGVRLQVVLALKPFRAFHAIVLSQAWQVLRVLCRLVLREMARGINVGEDLVVVSVRMVSTRLLRFKLPPNRRTSYDAWS